jgi:hypothetical protein
LPNYTALKDYKKIAKQSAMQGCRAVILMQEKTLNVTQIFRIPIGVINIDGQKKIIDSEGLLYCDNNENYDKFITREGDYKKWPKLFDILTSTKLLDKIYHAQILPYSINVWIFPGTVVQLSNITHLQEFYLMYPQYFTIGSFIDLRNTKQVGISKIKMPKQFNFNDATIRKKQERNKHCQE